MKPECCKGHSSHTAVWKQTIFNAQLQNNSWNYINTTSNGNYDRRNRFPLNIEVDKREMRDWERSFTVKTLSSTENFTTARYGTWTSVLLLGKEQRLKVPQQCPKNASLFAGVTPNPVLKELPKSSWFSVPSSPKTLLTWSMNQMEVDRAKMNLRWWQNLKETWHIFPCVIRNICLGIKNGGNPVCSGRCEMPTAWKDSTTKPLQDKHSAQIIFHKGWIEIKCIQTEQRTCRIKHKVADKVTSLWWLWAELKEARSNPVQIQKFRSSQPPVPGFSFLGAQQPKQDTAPAPESSFQSTGTEQKVFSKVRFVTSLISHHIISYFTWIPLRLPQLTDKPRLFTQWILLCS